MTRLPPLDMHAHVNPQIDDDLLDGLEAVVFVATRSLDEAEDALRRHDPKAVWGVGCHPGLVRAHKQFSAQRFADLCSRTPFVAELGLDGSSRVPIERQIETLRSALSILKVLPRIVSLHSYRATDALIGELERQPVDGVILHWWLGEPELTRRAVDLGCYFSVNASSVRRTSVLDGIPMNRILTETDHPFGDRWERQPRQPGHVTEVEQRLAEHHGVTERELRRNLWRNLRSLVQRVDCARLLPRPIRASLSLVSNESG